VKGLPEYAAAPFSDTNPGLAPAFSQNAHGGTQTPKRTMCERGQLTHETDLLTDEQANHPTYPPASSALEISTPMYIWCSSPELRNPTGNTVLALDTDWAKI